LLRSILCAAVRGTFAHQAIYADALGVSGGLEELGTQWVWLGLG